MPTPFEWIINKLADSDEVKSTSLVNEHILSISRTIGDSLTICCCYNMNITTRDVADLLAKYNTDFILYTYKDATFEGGVFEYMNSRKKILGDFRDVITIIDQSTNWPYQHPTVKFLMRILQQHPIVKCVRRVDNKHYEITRIGLTKIVAIALYEYEIGIEAVRNSLDKYNKFDLIIKANPYGRISLSAKQLAESHKIKVLWPNDLNTELRKEWR